jgi:hypothetical protein
MLSYENVLVPKFRSNIGNESYYEGGRRRLYGGFISVFTVKTEEGYQKPQP